MLSFLTNGVLYSRTQDVFLRELAQNSLDAIAQARAIMQGAAGFRGQIVIHFEQQNGTRPAVITISDNGIGMTKSAIEQELLSPMNPFRRKARSADPRFKDIQSEFIGRYGMGLMTAFHVSDIITVVSTSDPKHGAHLVELRLSWGPPDEYGDMEPESLDASYTHLETSPLPGPGTQIRVRLASECSISQKRIHLLEAESIHLALQHYLRHVDSRTDVFFEYAGKRVELPTQPHLSENSPISITDVNDYYKLCLGVRTDEPRNHGVAVCVRGILVSTDHPKILDDLGKALVAEIDFYDTRLVNLRPSREECIEDEEFRNLRRLFQTAREKFDREYRTMRQALTGPSEVLQTAHPLLGWLDEESDTLQAYLKDYSRTGHQYLSDLIGTHVRFRMETPAPARVSLDEVCRAANELGTQEVFYFTEESSRVEPLAVVSGAQLWFRAASQFEVVGSTMRNKAVILRLRAEKDKYSLAPVLAAALASRGVSLRELNPSFSSLSEFVSAEELESSPTGYSVALVHAGLTEPAIFPHSEGFWINADRVKLPSGASWEARLEEIGWPIPFLGLKLDQVEKMALRALQVDP